MSARPIAPLGPTMETEPKKEVYVGDTLLTPERQRELKRAAKAADRRRLAAKKAAASTKSNRLVAKPAAPSAALPRRVTPAQVDSRFHQGPAAERRRNGG